MSDKQDFHFDLEYEGELPQLDLREVFEKTKDLPGLKGTELSLETVNKIVDNITQIEYSIKVGKIPAKEEILKHKLTGCFLTLTPLAGGDDIMVQVGFNEQGDICGRYAIVN